VGGHSVLSRVVAPEQRSLGPAYSDGDAFPEQERGREHALGLRVNAGDGMRGLAAAAMAISVTRAQFLRLLGGLAASPSLACSGSTGPLDEVEEDEEERPPFYKSLSEWRTLLTPEQYAILFEGGTEPALASPLHDEERPGTYVCAACFIPLFSSDRKYDSGTGWPSFWAPYAERVLFKPDIRFSVPAVEYHCFRCYGHQGHIFGDGPPPTGDRYCNNGLALVFVPENEPLPALRS